MKVSSSNPARYGDAPARLWAAIRRRDSRSDGNFFYGVRSTGVYCRPSCPSRRPSKDKVVFFAAPEAAEQQGFRPCKRCSPRGVNLSESRINAVSEICRKIERAIASSDGDAAGAELRLTSLAKGVQMSGDQLERAFRKSIGVSPRQYAEALRMRLLKKQLRKGGNVTTALYDAGFGSASRLYEKAASQLGMTPRTYRRGGAGMQMHFTIVDSPLGRLLVAATEKGISALYLGDSDAQLEADLNKEYPRAEIARDAKAAAPLREWVRQIVAHLNGKEPYLDLPTDVQATAFQRRVWEELRKIPYGKTATYAEVARRIGKPSGVRAVARACATNPVSVVVPCHRVVRQGGDLAGYRWGLERKQALLKNESQRSKER
jgi:AraC family transcriptional regulator of adaptative response/methylated-DNA-[protein]-cysteine methyltransferase